ncbi:MAG: hypothetical protein ACFFDV_08450 [Candidatus Thorarchaeota archaeon]
MNDGISDLVEPVHAESFFSVSSTGEIHERLSYEYLDMSHYYSKVLRDERLLADEVNKLAVNLQYYLDQERVEINREQVRSRVKYCDIFLKGNTEVVAVVYLIDFAGRFHRGLNTIETWLEEEISPYDFEILWRFPVGTKVTELETALDYEVYEDVVCLWALEGEDVGGYERMSFILPSSPLDTR